MLLSQVHRLHSFNMDYKFATAKDKDEAVIGYCLVSPTA